MRVVSKLVMYFVYNVLCQQRFELINVVQFWCTIFLQQTVARGKPSLSLYRTRKEVICLWVEHYVWTLLWNKSHILLLPSLHFVLSMDYVFLKHKHYPNNLINTNRFIHANQCFPRNYVTMYSVFKDTPCWQQMFVDLFVKNIIYVIPVWLVLSFLAWVLSTI